MESMKILYRKIKTREHFYLTQESCAFVKMVIVFSIQYQLVFKPTGQQISNSEEKPSLHGNLIMSFHMGFDR